MKERIVLEEHEFYNLLYFLPPQMVKIVKKERKAIFIGKEIKPEKVPETWEDLKELCKDIKVDLKLCKDGTIYCYEHCLAKNRTIEQMWQIIKGLIGE